MVFGEWAMDLNAKKGLKQCGNRVSKGVRHRMQTAVQTLHAMF